MQERGERDVGVTSPSTGFLAESSSTRSGDFRDRVAKATSDVPRPERLFGVVEQSWAREPDDLRELEVGVVNLSSVFESRDCRDGEGVSGFKFDPAGRLLSLGSVNRRALRSVDRRGLNLRDFPTWFTFRISSGLLPNIWSEVAILF